MAKISARGCKALSRWYRDISFDGGRRRTRYVIRSDGAVLKAIITYGLYGRGGGNYTIIGRLDKAKPEHHRKVLESWLRQHGYQQEGVKQ